MSAGINNLDQKLSAIEKADAKVAELKAQLHQAHTVASRARRTGRNQIAQALSAMSPDEIRDNLPLVIRVYRINPMVAGDALTKLLPNPTTARGFGDTATPTLQIDLPISMGYTFEEIADKLEAIMRVTDQIAEVMRQVGTRVYIIIHLEWESLPSWLNDRTIALETDRWEVLNKYIGTDLEQAISTMRRTLIRNTSPDTDPS